MLIFPIANLVNLSKKTNNYDIIVCSGGDGTLDEVVTGVMETGSDIPLGYIPAGSTNDFASSLFIPKNMVEAAKVITEEKIYQMIHSVKY